MGFVSRLTRKKFLQKLLNILINCGKTFFSGRNNYQCSIIPYVETFSALDRPENCITYASQRDELQMSSSVRRKDSDSAVNTQMCTNCVQWLPRRVL